ncbi:MAG: MATE family efflux transporter [Firmicutes bacterium]|nr:MATE family efflux transporter [Bacillota bacterium]
MESPSTNNSKDLRGPDPGDRSITRELIAFSIPLVLSGLLQQLYSWVDAFIVGNIVGEGALAAIGLTGAVNQLFIFGITGFAAGINILAARHYGGGNLRIQKHILYTFSIVLTAAVLLLAVSCTGAADAILRLLSTPEDIFADASTYLRIILCGMPFLALYNVYCAVLRGMGDSTLPLYSIVVSSAVNLVLDLLFVWGLSWGVAGAALATFIAQAAMTGYTVLRSLSKYPYLRFTYKESQESSASGYPASGDSSGLWQQQDDGTFHPSHEAAMSPKFRKDILRQGLALAAPITIQSIINALGCLVLQGFMNTFGSMTVAAITTAYRVDMVLLLPVVNLTTGISTLTSQNIGAGRPDRAQEVLKAGSKLMAAIAVVLTAVIFLFGKYFILLFGVSRETAELGGAFFTRLAAFYIIFSLAQAFRGYLEGRGDVLFSGLNAIAALILRIILSYALVGLFYNMVIAYAEGFSWAFMLALYMMRYQKIKNRPLGPTKNDPADPARSLA